MPVYDKAEDSFRYIQGASSRAFGLISGGVNVMPNFQFKRLVPVALAGVSNLQTTFTGLEGQSQVVTTVPLEFYVEGSNIVCQYRGGVIGEELNGLYFLTIACDQFSVTVEAMRFGPLETADGIYYSLEWYGTQNKPHVAWLNGYKNKIYIEAYQAKPEPRATVEEVNNGLNEPQRIFTSVQERYSLDVINTASFWLAPFQELGEYSHNGTVILTEMLTGRQIMLKQIEFADRAQDEVFAVGQISYQTAHLYHDGLVDDLTYIQITPT